MRQPSMRPFTVITLLGILPAIFAQTTPLFFDPSIPVQRQGVPLDLAWAGGINGMQLGTIDLNGDGHEDILMFDRSANKVITLHSTGGTGTGAYVVTREHDGVYPFNELHDWVLLRDYDCDGRKDIFSYTQAGFGVYRNTTDENGLSFEQTTFRVNSDYVTSSGSSIIANLFVSQVDLPAIADVDGDGDLDVLTFSLLGSYMEYHKNMSMEMYGNCDSLKFVLRNKCWGYFSENFSDNAVTLNNPCDFNVPNPESPLGEEKSTDEDRAHAGSTVLALDLDGNGLMDLLLGDISFTNLVGLYNNGSLTNAHMTQEDTLFPSYDESVDLAIFPGGFHEDIDRDGKRDLVVSPNSTSLSHNFRSMWYYRNVGTDAAPVFDKQMDDLFQGRMLEFGEGAFPIPFDHNGDGLMDLVVANHGYFQVGNTYQGRLALLQNVGSATQPAFDLVTDDYMDLSQSGIGTAMYPAFGDVDGDGDMDMYIGDLQGRIHFYRNVSTGGPAQFQLVQANINDASGSMLDVGQFATPQFVDLDDDGLLDLIVGERNGNLNYYRNTGTASIPQWSLISESLGDVSTVEWWNITGHSVPWMFENTAGNREMLLGSESGWIYHYGNITGNELGTWTLLDSTFLNIYDGRRTGVCTYDFTGDGQYDLVIGNTRGGLSFWRSDAPNAIVGDEMGYNAGFTISPNPASDEVTIAWNHPADGSTEWAICDHLGQEVMRGRVQGTRTVISLYGLSQGIYHIRPVNDPSRSQRLVVLPQQR